MLNDNELIQIKELLNRNPNEIELSIFDGMWSEHCSYKTTKKYLKYLLKNGKEILSSIGSHAGTVQIPNSNYCVSFKIESHNHPSYVDPFQGSATGVGGILRDITAQGTRPIGIMDILCFGTDKHSSFIENGVVSGIGWYGNAFGVANIGGNTFYDKVYDKNPLVNALAIGITDDSSKLTFADAKENGYLVYVGSETGKDGIGGATFASKNMDVKKTNNRTQIQVGDPFTGRKLMEAIDYICNNHRDYIISCQDMGACGITCSVFEMLSKGNSGGELILDDIPLREELEPAEILMSESQERFMYVVRKKNVKKFIEIFKKFGLNASICGFVDTKRKYLNIYHKGNLLTSINPKLITDFVPENNLKYEKNNKKIDFLDKEIKNYTNKSHIYSRYDSTVGNYTVKGPNQHNISIIRIPKTDIGIGFSSVLDPYECFNDPYSGMKHLIDKSFRKLVNSGFIPIAMTNCLNFGNPNDKHVMWQIKETINGMDTETKTLIVPVTGGNVSLYNKTDDINIFPTPVVVMMGYTSKLRSVLK